MTVHVVLLRGINVGTANRISMASLREVLEQVGCTEVATYLQSGNAVVSWDAGAGDLEQQARVALQAGLLKRAPVMVRTAVELDDIVTQNPWQADDLNPKLLHVAFFEGDVDPGKAAAVNHAELAPERVAVGPRHVYVFYANGVRRSALGRLDVGGGEATGRNWNTVLALQRLAAERG